LAGLLAGRHGFLLETGCFEGSRAETLTLLPVIRQFQAGHGLEGMVVVAGAGMLPAANLRELDEAGLGLITGSCTTKAPAGLESTSGGTGTLSPTGRSSTPPPRAPASSTARAWSCATWSGSSGPCAQRPSRSTARHRHLARYRSR
jgi:hypothetical protein